MSLVVAFLASRLDSVSIGFSQQWRSVRLWSGVLGTVPQLGRVCHSHTAPVSEAAQRIMFSLVLEGLQMPTNPDSSNLGKAIEDVLEGHSDRSKANLLVNPNQKYQTCMFAALINKMRKVDKRFEALHQQIQRDWIRERENPNYNRPPYAKENQIRFFYSLFARVPLTDCGEAAKKFCGAVRKLQGEDGLRQIPELIFGNVSEDDSGSFDAVPVVREAVAVGS